MKRELSFLDKLRYFILWMRGMQGYGLIGTCSICNSSKLSRSVVKDEKDFYSATYTCHSCGSSAYAYELWTKASETDESA